MYAVLNIDVQLKVEGSGTELGKELFFTASFFEFSISSSESSTYWARKRKSDALAINH